MRALEIPTRDYTDDIEQQRALIEAELNHQLPPGPSGGRVACAVGLDPYGTREVVLGRYRNAQFALKEICRQFPRSTPITVSIRAVGSAIFLVAQFS